jgi:hypothetical protein
VVLAEQSKERLEGALLKDIVPALRAVTGDVAKCPDSLLTHVENGRGKKIDELGHSLRVDDNLSMFSCPRGDVRQCPSRFELGSSISV